MNKNESDPVWSLFITIFLLLIGFGMFILIGVLIGNGNTHDKKNIDNKIDKLYLNVDVYSYQLEESQTDSTPNIGAFGDTLEMDMGIIAISRDLKYFLKKNDTILLTLDNKKHTFVIKDIMGPRHRNSVDLLTKKNVRGKGQLWLKTQNLEKLSVELNK